MSEIIHNALFIGKGIILSLLLFSGGFTLGFLSGTGLALLRYYARGTTWIQAFIGIMRGTPVILQLSLVYFALPALSGLKISVLWAGILTFGLNSAAYIAEILRAGIEGLPKGQFEAAKTLQIPAFAMWKAIILPQVMKNIMPSLTNESIALLKETALIATIGGMDIMRHSQMIAAEQFTWFLPLCIAGFYYYLLVLLLSKLGKTIEKRGFPC